MATRKQAAAGGTNPILSGGRTIVLLFAIFFALAGFGALYLQKAGDENARRLADEGVTSLATITRKHTDTSHNTNRKASGIKRYVLEYSFPLAGSGKKWQGDDQVSEAEYDTVETGDQFDVRYWPRDPDIATILEDSFAAGAQLAKTIATVLLSLAALLVLVLLIWKFRGHN
ncbi:DUF3592 domain-containing protein [Thermodesulfobacteriota bacterium]